MYDLCVGPVRTLGFLNVASASTGCQDLGVSKALREKTPALSAPINMRNSQLTTESRQNGYACASL